MKSILRALHFLCLIFCVTSCSQSEQSDEGAVLRIHYEDLPEVPNDSDLQKINKAEDQDKLSIPASIIGRWDVFAKKPFSEQSPIELAFINNGSDPSNSMLFSPNLLDMYNPHQESANYDRSIREVTDFCINRVVSLDLSKAIVPRWYYSEIEDFTKLKHLRVSFKTFNLSSGALVLPKSLESLELVDLPFDEQLLEFVRSLHGLKKLTLISPQCANLTASLTHDAPVSYGDWIDVYSKRLKMRQYNQSITSLSLVNCNEQVYFALLRLEFSSLESLRADLNEAYPGSSPIFQLEQICAAKNQFNYWPRLKDVTYILDKVDRSRISYSLTNDKSRYVGITFEQMVIDAIKRYAEIENKPMLNYELNISSNLATINTK